MTEEIKEILDRIKNYPEKLYCLNETEKSILLDCIINLQQNLEVSQTNEETYRLEMQEITKIFGLDEHTLFDDVKNYAESLKQTLHNITINGVEEENTTVLDLINENERLKEEKEDYKESFNLMAKFRDKALERNLIYKSRCEKAIEILKLCNSKCAKETINILQGSDENE